MRIQNSVLWIWRHCDNYRRYYRQKCKYIPAREKNGDENNKKEYQPVIFMENTKLIKVMMKNEKQNWTNHEQKIEQIASDQQEIISNQNDIIKPHLNKPYKD